MWRRGRCWLKPRILGVAFRKGGICEGLVEDVHKSVVRDEGRTIEPLSTPPCHNQTHIHRPKIQTRRSWQPSISGAKYGRPEWVCGREKKPALCKPGSWTSDGEVDGTARNRRSSAQKRIISRGNRSYDKVTAAIIHQACIVAVDRITTAIST
jgi:hypothetical protein